MCATEERIAVLGIPMAREWTTRPETQNIKVGSFEQYPTKELATSAVTGLRMNCHRMCRGTLQQPDHLPRVSGVVDQTILKQGRHSEGSHCSSRVLAESVAAQEQRAIGQCNESKDSQPHERPLQSRDTL